MRNLVMVKMEACQQQVMERKNGTPSQHSEEEQPEKRPKTSVGPRPSRLCRFDQTADLEMKLISVHVLISRWIPGDDPTGKWKSRECVRRYRERIRADPEKYLAWKEKERLRYQQKRKTINDLSEPMKKLKRKAWREAKRRDRARKQVQAPTTHMIQTTNP
ncbi:hypothetical protein AMELA_G00226690 [Ameiurus melas]|uniref:Uncharacterized protein n=1 Tax=Ameiurus melas TaxID=219545 RepID=A0A7J5ZZY5_AMEME|nr:hypothetical protein AMELA_G00226690 [Ameiurus melas]